MADLGAEVLAVGHGETITAGAAQRVLRWPGVDRMGRRVPAPHRLSAHFTMIPIHREFIATRLNARQ
jgi:hypothetical protein